MDFFFHDGVREYHNEKLVGIREFLEQFVLDCFNENFSTDTRTPENNLPPPLDEVDEIESVSTHCALHFSSSASPSTYISTISNIKINCASLFAYNLMTYTIRSQNIAEREEDI